MKSYTGYVIKNTTFGFASKCINLILNFVSRTVFIYYFGATFLGINGLYSNILQVLSFAELGFGTALQYAIYKPVANNDRPKIVQLLSIYKKIYRIIAVIISASGLAMMPFLQYIVNGAGSENLTLFELRLYFAIFLTNTVVSYFVSYKNSYVYAKQKVYVVTTIDTLTNLITMALQIVAIIAFKNYIAYLLVKTSLLLVSRVIIALYLNNKYPVLKEKEKEPLPKEEKRQIYKDVKGLAVHQFSSVAIHATDNIIISIIPSLGVLFVGLVNNYTLIITSVTSFLIILFDNMTPSFGNIAAKSSKKEFHTIFTQANFINFWMYGFSSIAFFILLPPFITLWIGKNYLIDAGSFFLMILNVYLSGQSVLYNNIRKVSGSFNRDKWWSLAQAIINLVVSVICAKEFGLIGVYIGTIASRIFYLFGRPLNTYKYVFDVSVIKYYKDILIYFCATLFSGIITYYIVKTIPFKETIGSFVFMCVIVAVVPNIVYMLLFHRTKEFINMLDRVKRLLRRVKRDERQTIS